MNRLKSYVFPSLFIALVISAVCNAQEESISLDPNTGNYTIIYLGFDENGNDTLRQTVFIPATKIIPSIKSKFKQERPHIIVYKYKVRNDKKSKQPLVGVRMIGYSAVEASQMVPNGWRGSIVPNHGGIGVRINWSYRRKSATEGLVLGRTQKGFAIESMDLPGVSMVRLNGSTPIQGFPDEGPDPTSEVGKKFNQLKANDFVPLPAAVPKIPIPDPFDAAVVLASLKQHVQELIGMEQIDSVFASQLDRLFEAAIAAVNQGNLVAARSDIKGLKRVLHKEHKGLDKEDDDDDDDDSHKGKTGLINKLAAKVLVFDLKYIEKRLKDKHDD